MSTPIPPPAVPTTTLPPAVQPRGSEKIWAMLSHLSWFTGMPFIIPLVVYLAMRGDSDYAAGNAREALNFHLSLLLYGLCCVPLLFIAIGALLLGALAVFALIFAIIAAVKSSDGHVYFYPLTIRFIR